MQKDRFLDCGAIIDSGNDTCILGWGERTWMEKPTDEISFYFPDFFLQSKKPWFTHEFTTEIKKDELLELLTIDNKISHTSITWINIAKPKFQNAFEDLQTKFQSNILQKAVPYIFEESSGNLNLLQSLRSLLIYTKKYPVFAYGFWSNDEGMLGATPELLFQISDNQLETVACAGTCTIEEADEILHDQKQLHEHNLVVEGIRESLSTLGQFKKGELRVQKYTKLCHLITPITVQLDTPVSADQVTQLLHPTPALGAYPRQEGMRWLSAFNQVMPRDRFGAPVGYSYKGKSTCYVAIRNIQWKGYHLKLGAGCGIVPASQCESEWNEILLKIKSIKDILSV